MKWFIGAALRFVALGLVWLALSGADPANLVYGVIAAAAATALSLALLPPADPSVRHWPARLWGTIVLVAWFLQQSVIGGVDVARRAVWPTIDIAPAVVDVDVTLPEGPAQQLSLLLMNLLPGSMVQHVKDIDGKPVAEIHTLSMDLKPKVQWETLQRRVQLAFQTTNAADS